MEFTTIQQQAIAHREGPCLVLAVPGAGKTTILLERLRQLIASGVPAERIASITFSRQQAEDMQARYKKQEASDQPVFSTIHAFCYRILRDYARESHQSLTLLEASASYNKYRILDALYRQRHGRGITEEDAADFFRINSYLKNALRHAEEMRNSIAMGLKEFQALQKAYHDFKAAHHMIDFDDMLWSALQLLDQNKDVRRRWQEKFLYYQVDEAQDTSLVQWRILSLLAAPKNNLFIVADDDQAIYSFRGADPQILLHLEDLFPHTRVLYMQDNYRSTTNIVKLAAGLIRKNVARYGKTAVGQNTSDEKTQVILTRSMQAQTDRLMEDLPADIRRGSTAILFRNNLSALPLLDALDRSGIPFQLRSEAKRYFHHPVVVDILDFLHLSLNPADAACFSRIYYKMNQYLKKSFLSALQGMGPEETVWERLLSVEEAQTPFYEERLLFLEHAFERVARLSPQQALSLIYNEIGYKQFLKERARRNREAVSIDERILEWLDFVAARCKTHHAFIDRLHALENLAARPSEPSEEGSGPVLSTVHGSKGLEFDTVWMIDLIQTEFPSLLALESDASGNGTFLEEERRLFYVGMTRAKKKLRVMGREAVLGRKVAYSQFIDELAGKKRRSRAK